MLLDFRNSIYYMSTIKWTNELFINLHLPNGTHKKRVWEETETFLRKLSEYTSCHLHAVRGYEDNSLNSHEHACVKVPADELIRFRRRMKTFKPYKAWSWTHLVEDFDQDREIDAYRYVLVKHQPVMPADSKEYFCPRRYHRCREGRCSHIPSK